MPDASHSIAIGDYTVTTFSDGVFTTSVDMMIGADKETIQRVSGKKLDEPVKLSVNAFLVEGRGVRVMVHPLLPGGAREDQSMERLERAASIVAEPAGEPVEELGVARLAPHEAEVVGRVDEAAAEVPLPDAVDEDARGERVLASREPGGQIAPAAPRSRIGQEIGRAHV